MDPLPFVISIFALVSGIEYAGRSICARPVNYVYMGKAFSRVAFFLVYAFIFIVDPSIETARIFSRWSITFMLGSDAFYILLEHVEQARGREQRNRWTYFIKQRLSALWTHKTRLR